MAGWKKQDRFANVVQLGIVPMNCIEHALIIIPCPIDGLRKGIFACKHTYRLDKHMNICIYSAYTLQIYSIINYKHS